MNDQAVRILLVEHDPAFASKLEQLAHCAQGPFQLLKAEAPAQALTHLENFQPQLIFLDLDLPDGNGLNALVTFQERAPDTPIVALTEATNTTQVQAAIRAGAQDCLLKNELDEERFPRLVHYVLERHRVERDLQASKNFFRLILEHSTDLIAVLDREGRRIYNSPSYANLLGDPAQLRGTDSFLEVHPDDRDRIKRLFQHTITTGIGLKAEYRFLLKDGSVRQLESRGSVIRSSGGRPDRVVVVSRDITERKQTEEQAREREEFFRLISENVTDLIAVIDKEGKRIYNSASYEGILGNVEAIRGTNSFAEIHPEDRERIQRVFQETMRSGIGRRTEYRFLLPDGSVRHVESQGSVIRDPAGKPSKVVVVSRDITDRKRAEEALASERNLLRTVIDNLPDYVYVKDAESRFLLNNTAHVRVLGATQFEQVLGKRDSDFFPEALAARYLADERTVIQTGQPLLNREEPVKNELGQERWVLTTKVPLRDKEGRIVGLVGLSRDITERKIAAEKLNQAYQELARSETALRDALDRLRQSHEELQATQLQLIQAAKMESVGTLAAGVAHEVKNPLQTILMGVDYLAKQCRGGSDTVAMVLGDMREAVKRADGIIRGLLEVSAPSQPDLKEENLNSIVERALLLVKYELTKGRIEVAKSLAETLPALSLDKTKIEQALINIFMNAAHAMPTGGTLTIRTQTLRAGELSLSRGGTTRYFRVAEPLVVAEIEDTGTGIPEDKLSQIFDPFFTTKPTGLGTGLGLTVTKKIIELHGGSIEINNRPGRGVKVSLVFRTKSGASST